MDFCYISGFYIKSSLNRSNIKCSAMLIQKVYSTVELRVKPYHFTTKNHKTDPKNYIFESVLL